MIAYAENKYSPGFLLHEAYTIAIWERLIDESMMWRNFLQFILDFAEWEVSDPNRTRVRRHCAGRCTTR